MTPIFPIAPIFPIIAIMATIGHISPEQYSKGTRDVREDIPYAEVAHSRIELLFQE